MVEGGQLLTPQGAPSHARDDAAGGGTPSLARERVELRIRPVATGHVRMVDGA